MSSSAPRPILLVDDSHDDVQLMINALKRAELKNEVIALHDGEEALDYLYRRGNFAERDEPVVILLDIKMPKVNGLEVLQQIKSDEKLKKIPVVMLTSSNQESDINKSYQLGSNAYVVKPVDFNRLLEAVRTLGRFWAEVNRPPLPRAA